MATLDQFIKRSNDERPLAEYTPVLARYVKHATLVRLILLSFLEGGLGNHPKPAALFDEIYSTIIRLSKNAPLLYSLFGSKDVPHISRSGLLSQLKQMLEKGEVIRYGKGYRLNPIQADSVFLDLEIDPF